MNDRSGDRAHRNGGNHDGGNDGGWRRFAAASMTLLFTGLFVFAALADRFLSRFMPVFIGLMLVALLGYTLVVGTIRLIVRVRDAGGPSPPPPHRTPR